MCGIAGIVCCGGEGINSAPLVRMIKALKHRGPDGCGAAGFGLNGQPVEVQYKDSVESLQNGSQGMVVGLGHTRLAILDLSEAGRQPMSLGNGRLWIVYNGEIYNYLELRCELENEGYRFRTSTDTEVILAAYDRWGEACLDRFNGMWAFALWDTERRRLFCARDRMGIKPFYYVKTPDMFIFSSEIKALFLSGLVLKEWRPEAVVEYVVFRIASFEHETFYRGVSQLPPSHKLVVEDSGIEVTRWWSLPSPGKDYSSLNINDLRYLIEDAVRIRLRSDVDVGACMSGGIDSTGIVSIMSRLRCSDNSNLNTGIRTFTGLGRLHHLVTSIPLSSTTSL